MARERTHIRALIADDEPLARSSLRALLAVDRDIAVINECGSGREALAEIRSQKPDLVFLDVQMPELDGFDVLESLAGDLPRALIFVTAYDEYALRAFEAGALDYLLKPFDDSRFYRALGRAKEKLSHYKDVPPRLERLAIKAGGQLCLLKVSEIDWIEAADYYVCLHVGAKVHLLRRSLAELERQLEPQMFCRIHRSTIVHLARIQGLGLNRDGEQEAILEDGTALRISRRYRKALDRRLGVRGSTLRTSH